MNRPLSTKHVYCLCIALSCLYLIPGCTQEPDIAPISVSVDDIPADDRKLWGAVTFVNRQNRWGTDPRKKTWGTDDYFVNTPPVINGNVLTLNVSYGGGCKAHDFTLVTSGVFRESNPVELQAIIAHNANGDSCEAWLTETYHFDLSPLKAHYQKTYKTQAGTLGLRIKDIPELLVYPFEQPQGFYWISAGIFCLFRARPCGVLGCQERCRRACGKRSLFYTLTAGDFTTTRKILIRK